MDQAIQVGWELNEAPRLLTKSQQSRLQRLEAAFQGECMVNCRKKYTRAKQYRDL